MLRQAELGERVTHCVVGHSHSDQTLSKCFRRGKGIWHRNSTARKFHHPKQTGGVFIVCNEIETTFLYGQATTHCAARYKTGISAYRTIVRASTPQRGTYPFTTGAVRRPYKVVERREKTVYNKRKWKSCSCYY